MPIRICGFFQWGFFGSDALLSEIFFCIFVFCLHNINVEGTNRSEFLRSFLTLGTFLVILDVFCTLEGLNYRSY